MRKYCTLILKPLYLQKSCQMANFGRSFDLLNEWVAESVSSDVKDFNEQTDRSDYNIDYDRCPKQA